MRVASATANVSMINYDKFLLNLCNKTGTSKRADVARVRSNACVETGAPRTDDLYAMNFCGQECGTMLAARTIQYGFVCDVRALYSVYGYENATRAFGKGDGDVRRSSAECSAKFFAYSLFIWSRGARAQTRRTCM